MDFPNNLRYSKEHEWVDESDGVVTIGITDFAQDGLGDIVFVELPEVGGSLVKGETFGVVESVKTVSDLYCPVDGEIIEVNQALEDEPALVNKSPFKDGWMVKVKVSDPSQLDELLSADKYKELVLKSK